MKLLVSLVICGVLASAAAQEGCPDFVARAAWGGFPARFVPVLPIRPAPYVVVHPTHLTIDETCTTMPVCAAKLRDIQNFQMLANGWPDISYHFVMTAQNVFYTGRGWGRLGENVGEYNNQAINVGFLGSFQQNMPGDLNTETFNRFLDCGIQQGFLDANVRVLAQCQVTGIVACDSSRIHEWISEHPRFESNPHPV